VRAREHIARRILGMGDIRMSGTMPSGHVGILMPQRMYFIGQAAAVLDGEDLGQPVRVRPNPRMGQVPLPARGVLAVGQAAWPTLDERALTPSEATASPDGDHLSGKVTAATLRRGGHGVDIGKNTRDFRR